MSSRSIVSIFMTYKRFLSLSYPSCSMLSHAKIVCVRNKSKKKDWLAILSTDTSLSEEEIIRIYGKRWDIEVFFKSCKSYLRLVKECRSTSYDALNAHTAIVFTRYMMLSVAQRRNTDDKTLCELFFCLMDELDDITFRQSDYSFFTGNLLFLPRSF